MGSKSFKKAKKCKNLGSTSLKVEAVFMSLLTEDKTDVGSDVSSSV